MKNEVGGSYFLLDGVPFLGIIPKLNKSATTFLDNKNAVSLILSLDLVIKQLSDALLETFLDNKNAVSLILSLDLVIKQLSDALLEKVNSSFFSKNLQRGELWRSHSYLTI